MKIPMKPSRRNKPHQCGLPVDTTVKSRLRNRSQPLTSEQRGVVKRMNIKPTKNMTEKEAVKVLKRIVTGETNYTISGISNLVQKRPSPKPKRVSRRQHKMSVLLEKVDNGSNTAAKNLQRMTSRRMPNLLNK
jgi:hypothetical protein